MSRIDLAPEQMTATGVLPSSVKSALMSNATKRREGEGGREGGKEGRREGGREREGGTMNPMFI